jgi:hypothetical protein
MEKNILKIKWISSFYSSLYKNKLLKIIIFKNYFISIENIFYKALIY